MGIFLLIWQRNFKLGNLPVSGGGLSAAAFFVSGSRYYEFETRVSNYFPNLQPLWINGFNVGKGVSTQTNQTFDET